jgi:hypothetical protein
MSREHVTLLTEAVQRFADQKPKMNPMHHLLIREHVLSDEHEDVFVVEVHQALVSFRDTIFLNPHLQGISADRRCPFSLARKRPQPPQW